MLVILLFSSPGWCNRPDFSGGNFLLLPDNSNENEVARRKRPGRKKGLFDELEVFKHNLDIFAGPATHSASGVFLDELLVDIKRNQLGFGATQASIDASFFTVLGGVQYRTCPGYRDRGFLSMLSYAIGFTYQRRGYSYNFEKRSVKNSQIYTDILQVSQKTRASYLSVPLSFRVGRRFFVEAGLSLDFLLAGNAEFDLERSAGLTGELDNEEGYLSSFGVAQKSYRLRKIAPFASPGFTMSSGFYFNENIGFKVCANFSNAFFREESTVEGSNFGTTLLSVQLNGCINSNRIFR